MLQSKISKGLNYSRDAVGACASLNFYDKVNAVFPTRCSSIFVNIDTDVHWFI